MESNNEQPTSTKPVETCKDMVKSYEIFRDIGENAKREYEKVYSKLILHMKSTQLMPFSKILLHREKRVLKNPKQLIETVQFELLKELLDSHNIFWQSGNVSDSLIALEIYKDKCKSYACQDRKLNSRTPKERTRPIRIRLKEKSIFNLESQIRCQNIKLEDKLKQNTIQRERVKQITKERVQLIYRMEEYEKKLAVNKNNILQLKNDLLVNDPGL